MAHMNPVVVRLAFYKETKHTFRFDALEDDAPVANVYVRKDALPDDAPSFIRLTIEDGGTKEDVVRDSHFRRAIEEGIGWEDDTWEGDSR